MPARVEVKQEAAEERRDEVAEEIVQKVAEQSGGARTTVAPDAPNKSA